VRNLKGKLNPPRVLAEWPADDEALLTECKLAALLDLKPASLRFWRARSVRQGPPFIKLGRGKCAEVRYCVGDVREWLARQTVRVPLEKERKGPVDNDGIGKE
jgi:hypothetical protein